MEKISIKRERIEILINGGYIVANIVIRVKICGFLRKSIIKTSKIDVSLWKLLLCAMMTFETYNQK